MTACLRTGWVGYLRGIWLDIGVGGHRSRHHFFVCHGITGSAGMITDDDIARVVGLTPLRVWAKVGEDGRVELVCEHPDWAVMREALVVLGGEGQLGRFMVAWDDARMLREVAAHRE